MTQHISGIDWGIIAAYCIGLLAMAYWLSRRQGSREDYYVAGRNLGPWPVGLSIMATQCSTNSILGAPAFVAFTAGGGLLWLQYELAVPLAMVVLILFVMPLFRHLNLVSVYAYLEQRFDLATRLTLSGLFLFVRAFATAVTVYSIALVIDLITGLGFFASVLLLGAFTVVYDVMGGIRGVIYSDVLQLLILAIMLLVVLVSLTTAAGGMDAMWQAFDSERKTTLDFTHHGFGDGKTFAFWPMLFGGLFLYVSYYGCDQSQVQRHLSTRNIDATNNALLINGVLRFPLVFLYCLVGVGIGVYAAQHPAFVSALPATGQGPQYNLAVPLYMINALPVGLVGLSLVALFAAAMSSLDSVLNSLSATTMEDYVRRFHRGHWNPRKELVYSRGITAVWGVVTLVMAFYVGDIAPTVLEAINKVGSLANGPILAVFILGFLVQRVAGPQVIVGLSLGVAANGICWLTMPEISWLWWNVIGFFVTVVAAVVASFLPRNKRKSEAAATEGEPDLYEQAIRHHLRTEAKVNWYRRSAWLLVWFLCLFVLLRWLE
ncbi:sodium:solute symporter [Microbulbifer agarilyticus]|uniref:sodium:solute symporter n=1 Tax=Microbulbifer agarilyticus TaxID=260552 RepID=UPI001CD6C29E|nr:sodium:solute symporter [Microbulbifer agarilyticus]MCA0891949.1 sodium:solute symporter [Microbulbifer agarilyticus]